MNFSFLEDILEVFKDSSWKILWKAKRVVGTDFISNAFQRKRLNFIGDRMIPVDPGVAARTLVEASDAVISMPFSTPSLIAKMKGIPSAYYDSSELVNRTESHGIPVLKKKVELNRWFESFPVNHSVDICD
jgi:polysaccharide biosynthesis PFTS motif protein